MNKKSLITLIIVVAILLIVVGMFSYSNMTARAVDESGDVSFAEKVSDFFNTVFGGNEEQGEINPDGPASTSYEKSWLDYNMTQITKKTMNWDDLIASGGGENPGSDDGGSGGEDLTGVENEGSDSLLKDKISDFFKKTFTGDAIATGSNIVFFDGNLVYMQATGLDAGEQVYFYLYESDFLENGDDDTIIADSSMAVTANASGVATFAWQVAQDDIISAWSEDEDESAEIGVYEFYFNVIRGAYPGDGSTPPPVGTPEQKILELTIVYPDQNPNTIDYLGNAEGAWTTKDYLNSLEEFTFNQSQDNNVGMFVTSIVEDPNSQANVSFEIWEKDDSPLEDSGTPPNPTVNYDDLIINNTISSSIINQSIAQALWDITYENIQASEVEDYYEFYFKINYLGQSKSFRNFILNVTAVNYTGIDPGNGTDDCDGVDYCLDHQSQSMCEDPCLGVIDNEAIANPSANCSDTNVNCYCAWVDYECIFKSINSASLSVGSCEYIESGVEEDCSNSGYLTTSYAASWQWNTENCYTTLNECLLTIENSVEQSCSQADGCWRKINPTYLNCEDYDDLSLCSIEDPGSIGNQIKEDNWWLWILFLILGILVVVAVILFFIVRRKLLKQREKDLFTTKQNYNNVSNYILKEKKKGLPNYEIKAKLIKAGWTNKQVDYALQKASKNIGKNPINVTK